MKSVWQILEDFTPSLEDWTTTELMGRPLSSEKAEEFLLKMAGELDDGILAGVRNDDVTDGWKDLVGTILKHGKPKNGKTKSTFDKKAAFPDKKPDGFQGSDEPFFGADGQVSGWRNDRKPERASVSSEPTFGSDGQVKSWSKPETGSKSSGDDEEPSFRSHISKSEPRSTPDKAPAAAVKQKAKKGEFNPRDTYRDHDLGSDMATLRAMAKDKEKADKEKAKPPKADKPKEKDPVLTSPSTRGKLAQAAKDMIKQAEPEKFKIPDVPGKPFSANASYKKGDVISHPNFGKGVVKDLQNGKVIVRFADKEKILQVVNQKPASAKKDEPKKMSPEERMKLIKQRNGD